MLGNPLNWIEIENQFVHDDEFHWRAKFACLSITLCTSILLTGITLCTSYSFNRFMFRKEKKRKEKKIFGGSDFIFLDRIYDSQRKKLAFKMLNQKQEKFDQQKDVTLT